MLEQTANAPRNRPAALEPLGEPHALSVDGALAKLGAGPDGLDAEEAATRLRRCGPNRLPEGRKRNPVLRFLAQFNNVLI